MASARNPLSSAGPALYLGAGNPGEGIKRGCHDTAIDSKA